MWFYSIKAFTLFSARLSSPYDQRAPVLVLSLSFPPAAVYLLHLLSGSRRNHRRISLRQLQNQSWILHLGVKNYMSRVIRKPAFCICENKDADQLRYNREADQRLCFRHTDSTIPLLHKSKISSHWPSSMAVQPGLFLFGLRLYVPVNNFSVMSGRTAWFVSDLVGNPKDRFSHNPAHIIMCSCMTNPTIWTLATV